VSVFGVEGAQRHGEALNAIMRAHPNLEGIARARTYLAGAVEALLPEHRAAILLRLAKENRGNDRLRGTSITRDQLKAWAVFAVVLLVVVWLTWHEYELRTAMRRYFGARIDATSDELAAACTRGDERYCELLEYRDEIRAEGGAHRAR
jgi:hypothetical protein